MFPFATGSWIPAGDVLYLLIVAGGVAWLLFATMAVRLCSVAMLRVSSVPKPSASPNEGEKTPPLPLVVPDISTAVGIVMADTVIIVLSVGFVVLYRATMHWMGGDLGILPNVGIAAVVFFLSPAVLVAANRAMLKTNWLRAAAISIGYLVTALVLVGLTCSLFLLGLGK